MPSQNVELAETIYAAWRLGDFASLDWADPEIEFEIVGGPDPGSWSGLGAMGEGWRGWLSAWDAYSAQALEYRELDGEQVMVLGQMSGRGKTSGVAVETEFVNVLQIRDGRVVRLCLYSSRERAFAELGLDSQGDH